MSFLWNLFISFSHFLSDCYFLFNIFSLYTSVIAVYDLSCIYLFPAWHLPFCFLCSWFSKQSYLLNFMYSNLSNFSLGHLDLGHSRPFFYLPDYKENHPCFFEYLNSFSFTFKYLNHFEFTLLYGVKNISNLYFYLWLIVCQLLKILIFPHWFEVPSLSHIKFPHVFFLLDFLFHFIDLSVCTPISHLFMICFNDL